MEKVASLLRLSSKKQTKRKHTDEVNIPQQRGAIANLLATRADWQLVKEYEEQGVSGYSKKSADRGELQQAHKDAEAGLWSVLIVFKYDRLGRRQLEYLNTLDRFDKAGVKVWSLSDNRWLQMNDEEFIMRAFEGMSAQRYSKDLSDRLKPRMRQLASDGRWTGGHVPFGYSLDQVKDAAGNTLLRGDRVVRDLVPNECAPFVREIFARYLGGAGSGTIAKWINSLTDDRLNGKVWSGEAVRGIIKNPVYCGWIGYLYGRQGKKMQAEPILTPGRHPAIITKETWDEAQRLTQNRRTLPMRQRSNTYVLTGAARCGKCGAAIGGITRKAKRAGQVTEQQAYRCLAWKHKGTCTYSNMDARFVEDSFITVLEEKFVGPTAVRTFLEQREAGAQADATADQEARKQGRKRLSEIDTALKRLDRGYLEAGTITDQEYREKKAEYQAERRLLQEELDKPIVLGEAKNVSALEEAVKRTRAVWGQLTPGERKVLVLNLVKMWDMKVRVHPDKPVEIIIE